MDAEALQKMTVAELREEAKKLGDVKGIASMKKDDLVQLLAGGGSHTALAASATKKGKTGSYDLVALKHKMRELKTKRAEASAKGQKAKVAEYNSDLHVLRHHLRRVARKRRETA
jgi:hypothetical protein